jgi:hypothetical protein
MASSYRLVMHSGPTKGTSYPLEKNDMSIGRELGNEIVINDPEVSRHHARLFLQGPTFMIEDRGSTNGTFVSGQRLMGPYALKPGDMITFGEHISLMFEAVQLDPEATYVSGQMHPIETVQPPAAQPIQYAPPPQVSYVPPPSPQPYIAPLPAQPDYAGQVPVGPEEVPAARKFPSWLLSLLIAIVVLLCICGVVAYFMPCNWWCSLLGWLLNMFWPGVCPGGCPA